MHASKKTKHSGKTERLNNSNESNQGIKMENNCQQHRSDLVTAYGDFFSNVVSLTTSEAMEFPLEILMADLSARHWHSALNQ